MAKQQLFKNHGIISIKYDKNYNYKFYSKYFASIRDKDFNVCEGNIYEIILEGKPICMAKLLHQESVNFHEIPQFQMSLITGMNHADSLQHYYEKGLNIKSFDLTVKLLMFEILSYAPKQKQ